MAAASVNIYSPLSRLREDNQSLLSQLRQGQNDTWNVLKRLQATNDSPETRSLAETSFTFRGEDRTPVKVNVSRTDSESSKMAQTSTPKSYGDALIAEGNDRRNRTSVVPTSILTTPGNRKKTQKKALRVSFDVSPRQEQSKIDGDDKRRSLLGYDWIAGMLDNTSYLSERPDGYFDDLKEFRRVNKKDCFGANIFELPYSPQKVTPFRSSHDSKVENVVTCDNAYTLNERLFAIPIHGPETPCSVCRTKRESEYEAEGSYVRVSVPRSALLSPYRLKPHRRSSFDSTDSVGLSSHCLAGWESSKPTVTPMPSSLDLRTSLHQSRATLDASRAGRFPSDVAETTEDLLNRSHSLRYGLQVLERERRGTTQLPPFTTPYPIL
ncbi:migration and invasion-inhibitory protein-like isoform X1 [Montipora capricornis]|uniref:migration and invasion-inhibitory protein-like isoform X1 n=1 Tax=Montipora foliosa TaxID=591990 RepID=UPI0035F21224